jgi:CDP-2,3-bis-(O-geranylgeranyl)-sn-glycerol synthase
MDLVRIFLEAMWIMVPAYFANMAPVAARKIEFLNCPLDFGKRWHGERIFGKGKTFRGILFGTLAGVITCGLQSYLTRFDLFRSVSLFDYSGWNFFWIGLIISLSALLGDLAKSFIKRRLRIKEGKAWFPYDNMDYAVGVVFGLSLLYPLGVARMITIILVSTVLHLIVMKAAVASGIRKD